MLMTAPGNDRVKPLTKRRRKQLHRQAVKVTRGTGVVLLEPDPPETETRRQRQARRATVALRAILVRHCSIFWYYEQAAGRPLYDKRKCPCERCRELNHLGFPAIHFIGCGGISFDCRMERQEYPSEPEGRRMTERDAHAAGLTVKIRRHREPAPAIVLVAGCQRCEDGMRPRGDKYCLRCADLLRREMRESGYVTAEER